ncbi:hypothetical protein L3Q82_004230 [Scortum barcoo]|uniref:Uncharacterized protein n=1 Tax=Scortum barcoo TaxID=214431 RepID=A0ACB8VLS6_9TELE|nr:hypothetical protein L3Q82_004230 [Scortum barcoo]
MGVEDSPHLWPLHLWSFDHRPAPRSPLRTHQADDGREAAAGERGCPFLLRAAGTLCGVVPIKRRGSPGLRRELNGLVTMDHADQQSGQALVRHAIDQQVSHCSKSIGKQPVARCPYRPPHPPRAILRSAKPLPRFFVPVQLSSSSSNLSPSPPTSRRFTSSCGCYEEGRSPGPKPHMPAECWSASEAATVFTKLDLLNAYHLVRIHNDILIYSRTLAVHQTHIHQVLQRLLENKLFVKREKCELHASRVSFLSFIVQGGPEKVKAIAEWPVPATRKLVQRFLGFANFCCWFIPTTTKWHHCSPSSSLSHPFHWTPEADKPFYQLKRSAASTAAVDRVPPTDREELMQLGRTKVAPEERQRRLKKVACFYCGQPGHCVGGCQLKRQGSPGVRSTSVSHNRVMNAPQRTLTPVILQSLKRAGMHRPADPAEPTHRGARERDAGNEPTLVDEGEL